MPTLIEIHGKPPTDYIGQIFPVCIEAKQSRSFTVFDAQGKKMIAIFSDEGNTAGITVHVPENGKLPIDTLPIISSNPRHEQAIRINDLSHLRARRVVSCPPSTIQGSL